MANAMLCYVESRCAWFTTQPVQKQWGDDWNDAPYEHNAGDPYEYSPRDGREPYRLYRAYFEANYETPADRAWSGNSWVSVETINSGAMAWLSPTQEGLPPIMAGTTLRDFIRIILDGGGSVYLSYGREKDDER